MTKKTKVNAAILIIGNEILSGRTQDTNTSTLATWLNSIFKLYIQNDKKHKSKCRHINYWK